MYSQRIAAGARQMGLELDPGCYDKLSDYVQLLAKWNKAYNLTAVRSPEEMIHRHIWDSLAVFPLLKQLNVNRIIDVGTGPGLPGIPLSLCFPERQFTLLDSNSKKTRFLNQCKMELDLPNIRVIHSRAEEHIPEPKYEVVISRAFTALSNMVKWCDHLLSETGHYLSMKGVYPAEEIADIVESHQVVKVVELAIPETEGARHLILFKRKSTQPTG